LDFWFENKPSGNPEGEINQTDAVCVTLWMKSEMSTTRRLPSGLPDEFVKNRPKCSPSPFHVKIERWLLPTGEKGSPKIRKTTHKK
jgi:hypothetical protein